MKKALFFLLILPLFAIAQEQSFEDAVFETFEKSNERWIEYKNNLTLYLEEVKPPPRCVEEDELDSYFSEKWETSYQDLQQKIAELEESFWHFRGKLENVVSHHAERISASYIKDCVSVEVTDWYMKYLEKNLFGFEPGKQREIKGDLKLNREVARHFPYSFVEPPYISPHVIHSLAPLWPSYAENEDVAIELWNGQSQTITNYEFPSFSRELDSLETASFEYSYVGRTNQDIYVLLTDECTGGRGQFKGLLFLSIEVDPYLADENGERERVIIKRVGEHFLGDRWFGQVYVKNNQVLVVTNGYHLNEIAPQSLTLDLQHFFPSRPMNPIFAERLVTRNEDGPLFCAVYRDEPKELLAQMQEGISGELVQRLVFLSSRYGCFNSLTLLLDQGGDPNFSDLDGNTPLHQAVDHREFKCVQKLVEKGAAINVKNQSNCTPLVLAIKRGEPEIVDYLLKHGAAYELVDQEGRNLLHCALYDGWNREVAEKLFSLGVEANRPDMLSQAAYLGSDLIVRHMIEQGIEVDAIGPFNETALLNCFGYYGDVREELAEYLIEQGADIFAHKYNGDAPILKIIDSRNMHLLKKCLSKGVNLNQEGVKVSPLYQSAQVDWMEGVAILLEHGSNVNQQNPSDTYSKGMQTALHAAAANGNLEMVKLLREHGADLAPPDVKTPFAVAAEYNHKEILRYFIEQGVLE